MQVAVVGLPSSGKTTLCNLLACSGPDGNGDGAGAAAAKAAPRGGSRAAVAVRMAKVPDARVTYLSEVFRPRKTTYAQIEVADVPGISPGGNASQTNRFLSYLRTVDAFVYVVRAFEDGDGTAPVDYEIDPAGEVEALNLDLVLADLQVVENRIERLAGSRRRTTAEEEELAILKAVHPALADGARLDKLALPSEHQAKLKGYALLTLKPVVVVCNLSEAGFVARDYPGADRLESLSRECGLPIMELSARIELEIQSLSEGERAEFLAGYGIGEPAIARLSRTLYDLLGLASFFTVGEDEVKAWSIPNGTPAKAAAGKIHSDIAKGFIRAEVISYEDFRACGSVSAARARGLYRLEGKDYVVRDGDIVNFRFSPQ